MPSSGRIMRPAGGGRTIEVGDHLVDAQAGGADALAAERDQLGGSGDPIGELVDVDVARLELGEDALELDERPGVAELVGRGWSRSVGAGSFIGRSPVRTARRVVTVLVSRPVANCVVDDVAVMRRCRGIEGWCRRRHG